MKNARSVLIVLLLLTVPGTVWAYTVVLDEFTGADARVQIDITGDGTSSVNFDVNVLSPTSADILGIWFDLDPYVLIELTAGGPDVELRTGENSILNLGGGLNLNGAGLDPFDAIAIVGSPGIGGGDDFYTVSFTISNNSGVVHLGDRFGVRLTSVLLSDQTRDGSSKLIGYSGSTPVPEPGSFFLFGAGLLGLTGLGRRGAGFLKRA